MALASLPEDHRLGSHPPQGQAQPFMTSVSGPVAIYWSVRALHASSGQIWKNIHSTTTIIKILKKEPRRRRVCMLTDKCT